MLFRQLDGWSVRRIWSHRYIATGTGATDGETALVARRLRVHVRNGASPEGIEASCAHGRSANFCQDWSGAESRLRLWFATC